MTGPVLARAARILPGVAVLALVVHQLGGNAVTRGLTATGAGVVGTALVLTALATLAAAARWQRIARSAGRPLSYADAVGGYYRSQLLNATLPGGVLGDVERGLRHGRALRDRGGALRSVVAERAVGQLVHLVVLAVAVLLTASRPWVAALAGLVLVVLLGLGEVARRALGLDPRDATVVTLASVAVLACHVATFAVAARAVGVSVGLSVLLPLALLVLAAAALPLHVAGWGPREGVAAVAFAAAGLGGDLGLATSVAFGVASMVATLPGLCWLAARGPVPVGVRVGAAARA